MIFGFYKEVVANSYERVKWRIEALSEAEVESNGVNDQEVMNDLAGQMARWIVTYGHWRVITGLAPL